MIHLLPNILSAIRFPLGGLFAVLLSFRCAEERIPVWGLISCFIAIALSDYLDGWIARRFDCQSSTGVILDVTADSFYILLSLVVLNYHHVIPVWFTIIVILKLADFILSSRIFLVGERGRLVFDLPGRITAAGFYSLPVLTGILPSPDAIGMITLFLAVAALVSSVLRWLSFVLKQVFPSEE